MVLILLVVIAWMLINMFMFVAKQLTFGQMIYRIWWPFGFFLKTVGVIWLLAILFYSWVSWDGGLGFRPLDNAYCHTYFVDPKPDNQICKETWNGREFTKLNRE